MRRGMLDARECIVCYVDVNFVQQEGTERLRTRANVAVVVIMACLNEPRARVLEGFEG